MQKFQNYILKLREKPENVRRQILAGALTFCMVVVGGVWIYGLGSHFGNVEVVAKTKEDVKPFALFTSKIKSTYQGLVANAGKAGATPEPIVEEKKQAPSDKVIDLIPVEQ
jgi:hypothetical protein